MAAVKVLLAVVVECLLPGEEESESLGDLLPSLVAVAVRAVAVAVMLAVVESFLHVVVPADVWLLLLPPLLLLGLLLHQPVLDCAVGLPAHELVGAVALLLLLLLLAVAVAMLLPAVVLLLHAAAVLLRLLLSAAQLLLLLLLPAVVLPLLAVVLLLLLLAVVLLLLLLAVVLLLLLPLVAAVDDVRVVFPRRGRAVEPCPARVPPWHRGRPAPP